MKKNKQPYDPVVAPLNDRFVSSRNPLEEPMDNAQGKADALSDELTGLTENEVKLIQKTWRTFSKDDPECGVRLFLALFLKHPEYIQLFKTFRGKTVAVLKDHPMFRAHGCSIGYHITSMVESLRDPATFEILVRRNATEHLRRKGVKPYHFEVMGQCVVDELQSTDERHMTPAAVEAWGKFLTCMVAIIKDVYEKAAMESAEKSSPPSAEASVYYSRSATVMDDAMLASSPFGTAAGNITGGIGRAKAGASASLSPTEGGSGRKRQTRIIRNPGAGSKKSKSRTDASKPNADGVLLQESGSPMDMNAKEKDEATKKSNAGEQKP